MPPAVEDVVDDCDVHVSCPVLDTEVVRVLALKGFCVIGTDFSQKLLNDAAKDARKIKRFKPPPAILVEGFLGPEGSSEVADLERPELEPDERTDGDALRELDSFMTWVAMTIDPYLEPELGFVCGNRTVGMLHRVSRLGALDDAPDITEKDAARWLHIFRRHRLMCLIPLGSRGGVLLLRPFDEESEVEAVPVRQGQLVLLRADALSHAWEGRTDKDYVLSCWLLQQDRSGPRGAFADGRENMPMVPVARDIVEWANNRMLAVKEQQDSMAGSLADQDIPRGWKLIASHTITKGVQIAIRGFSVNLPTGCTTSEALYAPMVTGADFGVEVPFLRWDHYDTSGIHYDVDPDCWKTSRGKTNVRHATFIEGIEQFDNKFFNMSPFESKIMDPNQRLALEGAYEALHMAGYIRKSLMQAFIGVYQGHTASDWDKIPHDTAGGCAGSYSPTIASNRINFALGVMGPSFTIDVEGASSLAALYQGAHDLLPSPDLRKPLVAAALAGGVTINLSCYWWPVHNQFMDPRGRTMTFDRNAMGYIKGEGSRWWL